MKKKMLQVLMLVLCVGLIATACTSEDEPAPTPAPTPESTPAPTPAAEDVAENGAENGGGHTDDYYMRVATMFMDALMAVDPAYNAVIAPYVSQLLEGVDFAAVILAPHGRITAFEILSIQPETADGLTFVEIAAEHTMGRAVYNLVFMQELIAGMHTLEFNLETMPIPADASFTAEELTIGDEWPLPAILTMPDNADAGNTVPAAILVHGSGAHNRDSSIFDNRPFWDIAEYLSNNGIAVLRYDKRARAHPTSPSATVWEETIEDAILAAEILAADERISEVFVIGLSLGGMLAPQIAESADLAGAVLMAASPRALYEVQYDQNMQAITIMYEAGLLPTEQKQALLQMVEGLLEQARLLPTMTPEQLAATEVFGLPAIYQQSIIEALPLPIISASTRPTLILQGTRDFQVFADTDFAIFQEYTADMAHVTAILYENLNHLFMYSQTPYNDLRDYMVQGRVYTGVLRDITNWILAR